MSKKILISFIVLFLFSNGFGRQVKLPGDVYYESATKVKGTYGKPQFPSDDEIKKIKKRTPKISFPRVTFSIGGTFRQIDNTQLNQTFTNILAQNGASSSKRFNNPQAVFSAGLRLHINPKISFWWECDITSDFSDDDFNSVKDKMTVSYASLSFYYSFLSKKKKGAALSLGFGIATQRIKASHNYNIRVGSSGTLEYVKVDTGSKTGMPLTIMLELPSVQKSRFTFFIAARYIVSKDVSKKASIYDVSDDTMINASMKGTQIRSGITVGF